MKPDPRNWTSGQLSEYGAGRNNRDAKIFAKEAARLRQALVRVKLHPNSSTTAVQIAENTLSKDIGVSGDNLNFCLRCLRPKYGADSLCKPCSKEET